MIGLQILFLPNKIIPLLNCLEIVSYNKAWVCLQRFNFLLSLWVKHQNINLYVNKFWISDGHDSTLFIHYKVCDFIWQVNELSYIWKSYFFIYLFNNLWSDFFFYIESWKCWIKYYLDKKFFLHILW